MTNTAPSYDKIAFVASSAPDAEAARVRLTEAYGNAPLERAEVVVALGGDGFMLQMLHKFRDTGIPIYGMHRATLGFLRNEFREAGLQRLNLGATPPLDKGLRRFKEAWGASEHAYTEYVRRTQLKRFIDFMTRIR